VVLSLRAGKLAAFKFIKPEKNYTHAEEQHNSESESESDENY
jgi:hypothetical protein